MPPGVRYRLGRGNLRWRYLQCPDVSYLFLALRRWRKLVGWSVFRMVEGKLLWVDGLGSVDLLLRSAAEISAETGGYYVHPHLDPHWTDGYQAILDEILRNLPGCRTVRRTLVPTPPADPAPASGSEPPRCDIVVVLTTSMSHRCGWA